MSKKVESEAEHEAIEAAMRSFRPHGLGHFDLDAAVLSLTTESNDDDAKSQRSAAGKGGARKGNGKGKGKPTELVIEDGKVEQKARTTVTWLMSQSNVIEE